MEIPKIDKRRKYYFVLDCETATLPIAQNYTASIKKKIALAKPLIYDIGWQIMDASGTVYRRKSYLVCEIFSVPSIFQTAYYASKRPIYLEKLKKGEICLSSWAQITQEMVEDIEICEAVGAYNSMFDFKKAIVFTEKYINALYSDSYQEWERKQVYSCECIARGEKPTGTGAINEKVFEFRGKEYPLFDIWGLSCENLLNTDEFKNFCHENALYTNSKQYFSTTAETTYKFLRQDLEFVEAHTAIEDTIIECEILAQVFKKVKPKEAIKGITYFPFRAVGKNEKRED